MDRPVAWELSSSLPPISCMTLGRPLCFHFSSNPSFALPIYIAVSLGQGLFWTMTMSVAQLWSTLGSTAVKHTTRTSMCLYNAKHCKVPGLDGAPRHHWN